MSVESKLTDVEQVQRVDLESVPLAEEFLAMKVVNDIFSILVISEFNKPETILDIDFTNVTIALEETLDVPFAGLPREAAEINSGGHLGMGFEGYWKVGGVGW